MAERVSPDRVDSIELQRISLAEDPSTYGIGFTGVEPYMNVIALTCGEVASTLLDGLPEDMRTCVDRCVSDRTEQSRRPNSAQSCESDWTLKTEGDGPQ